MRDYASLYSDLLSDLGYKETPDSLVTSDMSVQDVSRQALALSFYKKLCPRGNSKIADSNALKKFEAINASLPENFSFEPTNEAESCFWDYFRSHLNTCLQPREGIESFDLESIRLYMDIGPGAAQKADASTLQTKLFGGEMSYTDPYLI